MNAITSNSLLMMEKSMDYLWAKQTAILDNLSNADTPGYKAKVVTFEETFRQRLQAAARNIRPSASLRNVLDSSSPVLREVQANTRMDGNGVNVTEQSVELVRNGYQLQYVMNAINTDFSILRTAIRGQ